MRIWREGGPAGLGSLLPSVWGRRGAHCTGLREHLSEVSESLRSCPRGDLCEFYFRSQASPTLKESGLGFLAPLGKNTAQSHWEWIPKKDLHLHCPRAECAARWENKNRCLQSDSPHLRENSGPVGSEAPLQMGGGGQRGWGHWLGTQGAAVQTPHSASRETLGREAAGAKS